MQGIAKQLTPCSEHYDCRDCSAYFDQETKKLEAEIARLLEPMVLQERIAQITAHRACCGTEHDPVNGKLHGYCVVCGIPWPCEYAGTPPVKLEAAIREAKEGR